MRVQRVPFDGVAGHRVAAVGLQVLAVIGLGAFVDETFLRADLEGWNLDGDFLIFSFPFLGGGLNLG